MKKTYSLIAFLIFALLAFKTSGQNNGDISPKWDSYYNSHPSEIVNKYSAVDFIKIIDLMNFTPQSSTLRKDVQLLKKVLLKFDHADLRQMSITGWYYCRTLKHDDYFELYKIYYNPITKENWDKYCPYLLPLMDLDDVINLK